MTPADGKSNIIPFPTRRKRKDEARVTAPGTVVFQIVRAGSVDRATVIELILASLNAGDAEREKLIEKYLDDLPLEISGHKTRDTLRWEYWRGLACVDSKEKHSDEFISEFKHACSLFGLK